MKNKLFFTMAALLGVFIMIDTPLLAQSTGSSRESSRESARESERSTSRIYMAPEVDVNKVIIGDDSYSFATGSWNEKNSRLSLSKHYSGQSADKTGTFQVEEGVTKIRLQIEGQVTVGKIHLKILLPDKKEITKITIDDSANVGWSQSINIKEDDTKYFGDWTYIIKAESVEGHYQMSISTY